MESDPVAAFEEVINSRSGCLVCGQQACEAGVCEALLETCPTANPVVTDTWSQIPKILLDNSHVGRELMESVPEGPIDLANIPQDVLLLVSALMTSSEKTIELWTRMPPDARDLLDRVEELQRFWGIDHHIFLRNVRLLKQTQRSVRSMLRSPQQIVDDIMAGVN